MIDTFMTGQEIDRNLKAIKDAENTDNNGLVLYIHNGDLAFEDGEKLFDIVTPEENEE